MRHFKFVGGPWDGEYRGVSPEIFQSGRLEVKVLPLRSYDSPVTIEYMPVDSMLEYTTYTLRHMSDSGDGGDIYYFADSAWTDMYALSQLIHHYPGRPRR